MITSNLFINTINSLYPSFVIFNKKAILFSHKFTGQSEKLILEFHHFCQKYKIALSNQKSILVLAGPGSFSAVRSGMVLANSLNFLYKIPVLGIKNKAYNSLEEIIKKNFDKLKKAGKNLRAKIFYSWAPV